MIAAPLLLACSLAGTPAATEPLQARSIAVHTSWAGLGDATESSHTIRRRGDGYRRGLAAAVDAEDVDRFVRAVESEPVPEEQALASIATPFWLAAHADVSGIHCSAAARAFLLRQWTDRGTAIAALRASFSLMTTDDYLSASVRVTLGDGRVVRVESTSQRALMLPWTVDGRETWNPEIARALVRLLPAAERETSRLTDSALGEQLLWYLTMFDQKTRSGVEALEQRCEHSKVAAALEKHFTIGRVYNSGPGVFSAELHRPQFPPNLDIDVHLVDRSPAEVAANVETLLARMGAYVDLARPFVAAHPEQKYVLSYHEWHSVISSHLPGIAVRTDAATAKRIEAVIDDAVNVRIQGTNSDWIILPGGEVIELH